MKPYHLLFAIALIANITWFANLGVGRARTTGNDTTSAAIYVIITASMAWLGESLLRKLQPVQRLRREQRLLKRRVKTKTAKVNGARKEIISIEERRFWWLTHRNRYRAAHTISKDHTRAEQQEEHELCER